MHEVATESHHHFVISRLWRNGQVSIPTSDRLLQKDDIILVITNRDEADALRLIFGEQEQKDWNRENIDWNSVDGQLISQRILVTRPEINGKKLSSLRLRNNYGINISRVYRSGVQLLATPDLRLQLGDRLTVVGEAQAIRNVEKILGNAVKSLNEPNLVAVFIGLILGLTLGSIPFAIPGISIPVKLGLAGGPIIVGILIGTFGPRMHMITYTTQSANLMLRALGLSMYLACLGLDAGTHFFETVMRPEGLLWLGVGFALTFIPVVLIALPTMRLLKVDFGSVAGLLCGAMANPMALNLPTTRSRATTPRYPTPRSIPSACSCKRDRNPDHADALSLKTGRAFRNGSAISETAALSGGRISSAGLPGDPLREDPHDLPVRRGGGQHPLPQSGTDLLRRPETSAVQLVARANRSVIGRTVHIDQFVLPAPSGRGRPSAIPGSKPVMPSSSRVFAAQRLVDRLAEGDMTADSRIPASGLNILPQRTPLQVEFTPRVEKVKVHHRVQQHRSAVAFAARGPSDHLSRQIHHWEELLAVIVLHDEDIYECRLRRPPCPTA